jgi:hypothetical protein
MAAIVRRSGGVAALRDTGRGRARGDGGVGRLGTGLERAWWRSEMVRRRMGAHAGGWPQQRGGVGLAGDIFLGRERVWSEACDH